MTVSRLRNRSGATYKLLTGLLCRRTIDLDCRLLALASGEYEEELFCSLGFKNVRLTGYSAEERIDAMSLPFADQSFDVVFIEAALHHLSKPHLCIYEMHRVAAKSVIICETQDNLLTKLLLHLRMIEDYEHSAVAGPGNSTGGVDGSGVPNYVYRWRPGELMKVFRSLDPSVEPALEVEYSWEFYGRGGFFGRLVSALGNGFVPSAGNCFALHLDKRASRIQSWVNHVNTR